MGSQSMPLPEPSEESSTWLLEDDDMLMFSDDAIASLLPENPSYATQVALDALFDAGFTWEEGLRLLAMRDHYYELPEVRERIAQDPHLNFARWLVAHGVLSET